MHNETNELFNKIKLFPVIFYLMRLSKNDKI